MTSHGAQTRRRFGAQVRALRELLGLTQAQLGRHAGMSQSLVSEIERGEHEALTIDQGQRLSAALGGRLSLDLLAPHLTARVEQRDPAHAAIVAFVARRLAAAGWLVRSEVEIGGDRSRGWIDLLACRQADGRVAVVEAKTDIVDIGAIQRQLGWYEREAWRAARREGWRPSAIGCCLLLLATDHNDRRILENAAAINGAFPARAKGLNALFAGGESPTGWAIAMVDPRSRRETWCRPLRLDGRRSAAPYPDYAGFMRARRRGRGGGSGIARGDTHSAQHA